MKQITGYERQYSLMGSGLPSQLKAENLAAQTVFYWNQRVLSFYYRFGIAVIMLVAVALILSTIARLPISGENARSFYHKTYSKRTVQLGLEW
jgi:hypothetical protein